MNFDFSDSANSYGTTSPCASDRQFVRVERAPHVSELRFQRGICRVQVLKYEEEIREGLIYNRKMQQDEEYIFNTHVKFLVKRLAVYDWHVAITNGELLYKILFRMKAFRYIINKDSPKLISNNDYLLKVPWFGRMSSNSALGQSNIFYLNGGSKVDFKRERQEKPERCFRFEAGRRARSLNIKGALTWSAILQPLGARISEPSLAYIIIL